MVCQYCVPIFVRPPTRPGPGCSSLVLQRMVLRRPPDHIPLLLRHCHCQLAACSAARCATISTQKDSVITCNFFVWVYFKNTNTVWLDVYILYIYIFFIILHNTVFDRSGRITSTRYYQRHVKTGVKQDLTLFFLCLLLIVLPLTLTTKQGSS